MYKHHVQDLYAAINVMREPSLIRVEADEVTYPLHIILRYEVERALVNGELKVADVPAAWNKRMQEYLGCTPPDDKQVGRMQGGSVLLKQRKRLNVCGACAWPFEFGWYDVVLCVQPGCHSTCAGLALQIDVSTGLMQAHMHRAQATRLLYESSARSLNAGLLARYSLGYGRAWLLHHVRRQLHSKAMLLAKLLAT